jgi:signal transduction histidine kinase
MSAVTDRARERPTSEAGDPAAIVRTLGSFLAHQLRTPLTTIYAGADLIAQDRLPPDRRAEAAGSIARESRRLHAIVEDLVVFVRDEEPEGDPEPLLVQRLIAVEVDRRRRASAEPAIELRAENDIPPILASQAEVEHVIRNLIEHAALNTPPGGRIKVDVRNVGERVEVAISDEGPGRDEAAASTAFDLFAATHRDNGDASGANLGLVVARRLAEGTGGALRALASDRGQTIVSWPGA